MSEYNQLKLIYEKCQKQLTKNQGLIYLSTFGVLAISYLTSQILLRVFDSSSLFFYSSFWMLIIGLPLVGHQHKKGRELDQKIVTSLLQGINLEHKNQEKPYFKKAIMLYRKECKFIASALPMLGLIGLIIAWGRVILKNSGCFGQEYFQIMAFGSVCLGLLAIYVLIFSSSPYRKLLRESKSFYKDKLKTF